MKKIGRTFLLSITALYFAQFLWGNMTLPTKIVPILILGVIFTLFELIIKPILNILLLPITIITLGLIRILTNTLGLALAIFLTDGFKIEPINGSHMLGLTGISASGIMCYILLSLTMSVWKSICGYFFTKKVK